jgi:hypothetical protein
MEVFLNIPDCEGYEVSNYGNIRNNQTRCKVLSYYSTNKGYIQVNIKVRGKNRNFFLHRLVAITFLPRIRGKDYVDHIDRDKTNNHVSNLRWVTARENNYHKEVMSNTGYRNITEIRGRFYVVIEVNRKRFKKSTSTIEEAVKYRENIYQQIQANLIF